MNMEIAPAIVSVCCGHNCVCNVGCHCYLVCGCIWFVVWMLDLLVVVLVIAFVVIEMLVLFVIGDWGLEIAVMIALGISFETFWLRSWLWLPLCL